MNTPTITDWIKQARAAGLTEAQISEQLTAQGWQADQITQALNPTTPPPPPIAPTSIAPTSAPAQMPTTGYGKFLSPKLLGPGQLLREAWEMVRQHMGSIFALTAIFIVLEIILFVLYFFVFAVSFSGAVIGSGATNSLLGQFISGFAGAVIGILLMAVIGSMVTAWIQGTFISLLAGEQGLGVMEVMKRGWRVTIPLWWIAIVLGFIVGGGNMLFGIPGIIFLIWFSFAPYIQVMEGDRGMKALLKSKEYVRGLWWPIFGRIIVLSLVFFGIFIAFAIFAGILSAITSGDESASTIVNILLAIPYLIGIALALPFSIAYYLSLYRNLRSIHTEPIDITHSKKGGVIATAILGWIFIPIILIGMGAAIFGGAKSKASDAQRRSDLGQIRTAVMLYYDDNHEYPASLNVLPPMYISHIPLPPAGGTEYVYTTSNSGSTFTICTELSEESIYGTKNYCLSSDPALNTAY